MSHPNNYIECQVQYITKENHSKGNNKTIFYKVIDFDLDILSGRFSRKDLYVLNFLVQNVLKEIHIESVSVQNCVQNGVLSVYSMILWNFLFLSGRRAM